MTKCHLLLSAFLVLLLPASCRQSGAGPSLSEYGNQSEATHRMRFEQYVRQLLDAAPQEAYRIQDSLLREAENDSLHWQQLLELEDLFLLDPNSPYRDEERYLPVADRMLTAAFSTEEQRAHAAWLAPRLRLNTPGTPAADFAYITPRGRRSSLYETIDGRNPGPRRTLLFFSNPGCPNCREITEALAEDPDICAQTASGELLVINIYPDDDLQAWLDHVSEYPDNWICGYDPDQVLNSGTRYWLRAIPSLYLLDEDKRVLLKDAPLVRVLIDCKQR